MRAIKIYWRVDGEGRKTGVGGYRVIRDDGRGGRNDLELIMALTNEGMPWLRLDEGRLDVKRLK